MEELIFFGIIIALSIIDSIARTVKARREASRRSGTTRAEPEPRRSVPARTPTREVGAPARSSGEDVPTYDAEPSYDAQLPEWSGRERATYDDAVTQEGAVTYDEGASYDDRAAGHGEGSASSSGMIPQDLWEEIAALARGRVEPSGGPAPLPAPSPVRRPVPAARRRRRPARPSEAIHLSHAQFGTDPSERIGVESRESGRADERRATVRAVRAQLAGDPEALRRAVILHEVLGPPVALREGGLDERLER